MVDAVQVKGLVPYARRPGPDPLSVQGCGGQRTEPDPVVCSIRMPERAYLIDKVGNLLVSRQFLGQLRRIGADGSETPNLLPAVGIQYSHSVRLNTSRYRHLCR